MSQGIKVNCIIPERIATPMRTANLGIEYLEFLLEAERVVKVSLKVLSYAKTGIVVDVRKDGR